MIVNRPYIECISLSKQYEARNKVITAVKDINLKIECGELVLLKGRSGAGKSTLLSLIGGLISPTSGTVIIDDHVLNELSNKVLSDLLLNRIGIIFQSFNLLPTFSVYENIEAALTPKGFSAKEIRNKVMPALEQFNLMDQMHQFPEELSVGQQQKVAIVRTLVKEPSVIIADEPTASVDEETACEILNYLKELRTEKKLTIILATHGIIMESYADRTIRMENGCIINN